MEAVEILDVQTEEKSLLKVDGVLIHVGIEPNTDFLGGNVPLNEKGQILANERMETEIPGILAAGDVRHDSPCQISTAVGDGTTAALSVIRYLGGL